MRQRGTERRTHIEMQQRGTERRTRVGRRLRRALPRCAETRRKRGCDDSLHRRDPRRYDRFKKRAVDAVRLFCGGRALQRGVRHCKAGLPRGVFRVRRERCRRQVSAGIRGRREGAAEQDLCLPRPQHDARVRDPERGGRAQLFLLPQTHGGLCPGAFCGETSARRCRHRAPRFADAQRRGGQAVCRRGLFGGKGEREEAQL